MRESAHDDKKNEKSFWGEIASAPRQDAAGTVSPNKINGLTHSRTAAVPAADPLKKNSKPH